MESQKLGPYELQQRLGRGGMGAVYKARHEQTGELVAVKILAAHLADDPGLRQRFEAEIETLKPLRSNGIVQLLAFGEQDGQPYFAMELVQGKSLSECLKSEGPFSWRQTTSLAVDIVRSLKVAHDHGIIHRDLKPANLLLVEEPAKAGVAIKLADFGIARLFGSAGHTAHGSIVGTAEFMAPEQASGKVVDARADLYALGLVMFTMLTGKPPFRGAQLTEIITRQLHEKPPEIKDICPSVPTDLAALIQQLLEKDPAKRPASALAVGRRLSMILNAIDSQELAGHRSETRNDKSSGEPSIFIRPQVPPSTPTVSGRESELTQSPVGRGVDLEAATRDATKAGGVQATDETIDLPHQNTAETTEHVPGTQASSGDDALTTDYSKSEVVADDRSHAQHKTALKGTRRKSAAVDTSPASSDTVVDELRGSRFVTMAEIDHANKQVDLRRRSRQYQIQVLVTVVTAILASTVAYLILRPPTADQLYDRIAAVAKSPDGDLRDVAREINAFLSAFPDDLRVAEVSGFDLRRRVDLLDKRSRRRILGNRPVTAIERDYRAAITKANDSPTAAVIALKALATVHREPEPGLSEKDHAVWLALVQRQIENLGQRAEVEQQADRKRAEKILAEAATLAVRAKAASADEAAVLQRTRQSLLFSLIETYGDRAHMVDAVEDARDQLAIKGLEAQ